MFSYIPLSQCKLQAECCSERLHVTVSGKIASLSLEGASNCIQVFVYGAILGFVRSRGVSPIPHSSSIGFTHVKNAVSLPLLRLVPPGINLFLIAEFTSLAFPTWQMYSVNPCGNSTLSCNAGSTALFPECP